MREELWAYLTQLGQVLKVPWLLAGDFNQIVDPLEKSGGRPATWTQLTSLWNCFTDYGLVDLGFSGPKFTWTNNRTGRGKIRERLDRAMCNTAWKLKFPDHCVRHLARTHSDHHPLLISCARQSAPPSSGIRHFRMQEMWFRHPTFEPLITKIWLAGRGKLRSCFHLLPQVVCDWNRHVFGNLFHRNARCRARLDGIQRSLSYRESTYLEHLETKLLTELHEILFQEHLFWRQKAGVRWIQGGEQNTRYFHQSVLIRRSRQRILQLKDTSGQWQLNPDLLQRMATEFYIALYT